MKVSTVMFWIFDWVVMYIAASTVGRLTDNIWYVIGICVLIAVSNLKNYMEGYMKHSNKIREMMIWNTLKY